MSFHTKTTDFDVIVVGGGPSGFMAAIAAGRLGAKTLLVERYGFLGGMATSAALGPISPFHYGDEQVVVGLPQEFVDRMVQAEGSTGHLKCTNPHGSGSYLCFYDREVYKWSALQLVLEAGVTPLFHTFFSTPIMEGDRVCGVEVINKSGLTRYTAKVVVDATGDGDVAARAGAEFVLGRSEDQLMQPGTMMFDMSNVDTDKIKHYMDQNPDDFEWASECVALRPFSPRLQQNHFVGQGFKKIIQQGLTSGELFLGRDSILFLTTCHPGVFHFNSTRIKDVNGVNAQSVTMAEIEARTQVMSLSKYIINHLPGFENAYLSTTGIQTGIRESRHIVGEYVLTGEDVQKGHKFDDVITRGYFPIDIHNLKGNAGYVQGGGTWQDLDDSYDIPLRCLIPKQIDGLVITGRTISATHEAHGSLRTQGGVMAIGQASGTTAGLAALQGIAPRKINVPELQNILEQNGASLRRDPQKVKMQQQLAQAALQKALHENRISGLYMGRVK
jgi:hypothetical protein